MSEFDDLLKKRAMEAGVPIYEDDSLATLLGQIKLGAAIPTELYQAIVEIYIYFLGYVPEEKTEGEVPEDGSES